MKRRTRRKTAHWIIEYNHQEDCLGAPTDNGEEETIDCDCEGWTRVREAFFIDSYGQRKGSALVKQYDWVSKPRSLGNVLRGIVNQRDLLDRYRKRGVNYRIYNVRTKETYPIEAFQD